MISIYMRNYLKLFKQNSGFTLIELLVVIGILGVLAAALIATIDPFEQIKKAQDANTKNAVVEFVDANIRYYSTHNNLPWDVPGSNCSTSGSGLVTGSGLNCIGLLIADGELKTAFTAATGYISSIQWYGGSNSVTACFAPASKSQRNDPNTKYTLSSGTFVESDSGHCPNATNTDCYFCSF